MCRKDFGKLLKIVAIVPLIFGIVCIFLETGNIEYNKSYGGDAYTGIQNASAEAANNIRILNKNIKYIAEFFFFTTSTILGSIGRYLETAETQNKKENSNEETKIESNENENLEEKSEAVSHDTNEIIYSCPQCGEQVKKGIPTCPKCSQEFIWN